MGKRRRYLRRAGARSSVRPPGDRSNSFRSGPVICAIVRHWLIGTNTAVSTPPLVTTCGPSASAVSSNSLNRASASSTDHVLLISPPSAPAPRTTRGPPPAPPGSSRGACQGLGLINSQFSVASQCVEIGVAMQDGNAGPDRYGSDPAIHQFMHGLPFPPCPLLESNTTLGISRVVRRLTLGQV